MGKGDTSGKEMANVATGYKHVTTTPKFKQRKMPAVPDFPLGCRRGSASDFRLHRQIAVDQGKYSLSFDKPNVRSMVTDSLSFLFQICPLGSKILEG
ncbi:hypothetical protein J1N35_038371 [Gossypium stocksii]|uniref:Uncharacterized protein n=1 Tax=Gossypium stocksii TaxID=47602 RepID=A0A9D3ULW5_9ROSI|nr:hypothetical protein J1N35_038371 [Gossypium stocksii]